ncbi:unnamed protein product [Coffea canephora]|uniref:Uncharacterized protein n=1 Tax=Coffea canephora TaxID=49390 RepID=A0A068TQD4_COFCA|nr:unnamed protein product [Coffea canephora]
MPRLTPPCTPSPTFATTRSVSLIRSINSFWAKCTRQASKATKKFATNSPKSPLAKPKQLLVTLSNKAINFKHKKKVDEEFEGEIDFGDGGLWQRNILMGDKCQPLDFSGVIYYDSNGKKLSELPMKSPRASPLPSYLQKQ